MVVCSLALILAAAVLFGVGAVEGSAPLFGASIAVSLLAALALVYGVRQAVGQPVPRVSRPRSKTLVHTVKNVSGTAAAWVSSRPRGTGRHCTPGATQYSA